MAITVILYYKGRGGAALSFVREMQESGVVEKIREERGTLRYDYFIPIDEPETVLLIGSWADQESLDAHYASSLMETVTALREKHELEMKLERFEILPQEEK